MRSFDPIDHAATLERLARRLRDQQEALAALRFCRNVQATKEKDEAENARRLDQLIEAVDRLLRL